MPAIGFIGHDYEHLRIMRELRRYGVVPANDKQIDKAKLAEIKNREDFAEEIAEKRLSENEDDYILRTRLEELKVGAMTLAEINKVIHGL